MVNSYYTWILSSQHLDPIYNKLVIGEFFVYIKYFFGTFQIDCPTN